MNDRILVPESTLKPSTRHGCFLWWPVPGEEWLHADDRFVARRLIPGDRVLACDQDADGWNVFQYGRISFRAQPAMWTEVPAPEFQLGEFVEVLSRMGKGQPLVAVIREVRWNRTRQRIVYRLAVARRRLVRMYLAEELELSSRIGEQVTVPRAEPLRSGGYFALDVPRSPDGAEQEEWTLEPELFHDDRAEEDEPESDFV